MAQGILPVDIEVRERNDDVTSHAGLVLVSETMKALSLDKILEQELGRKQRKSGATDSEKMQSLILLMAAGGECVQDIDILRADKALQRLLGASFVSADALLTYLNSFHSDELIAKAKAALPEGRVAYIPDETPLLQGLGRANTRFIQAVAQALSQSCTRATLDHDATILESNKVQAKAHYKGGTGYQPVAVLWVELDLVVADEYRDGNVPAAMGNVPLIRKAFCNLPGNIRELYFRADSACYQPDVLQWLANPKRSDGPVGHIGFAISADMTKSLRRCCTAVAESEWQLLQDRVSETVCCCEVAFRPDFWPPDAAPLRYVAIRIQKKQRRLFADCEDNRYLAVVTNRKELSAVELVRWHRAKAGTIELLHDVTKNELAAAVPPCKRFGANAAWYRAAIMAYNVQSAMKQLALGKEFSSARPKRLRFCILSLPGKVVSRSRKLFLVISEQAERIAGLVAARLRLLNIARALAPA